MLFLKKRETTVSAADVRKYGKRKEKKVYDCIGQEAIDVETISRKLNRNIQEVQYSLTFTRNYGKNTEITSIRLY